MSKWMERLTKDFGIIASDAKSPTESIINMPSPSLNWAIGNGGLTKGKAMCLYGGESAGKSLISLLIISELHKQDTEAIGVLFDSEYSFNPEWARKLGIDLERLVVRQTNDPEKIFDWIAGPMNEMIQDGAPIKIIMIDSVKAIRYPKDVKNKSTDSTMGGSGAAYLGPALKMILPVIRDNEITTLLVQQVYEEMDQYKKITDPYIIPDGRGLKHFCDYMLQVDRIIKKDAKVEEGKNIHGAAQQKGHKVRVKTKKNRVGAPYRTAEFTLYYEKGIINKEEEIYELAKSLGLIRHPINPNTGKVSIMMWQFKDYEPIKGEANMRAWATSNEDVLEEIYQSCLKEESDEAVSNRNKQLSEEEITSEVGINLGEI